MNKPMGYPVNMVFGLPNCGIVANAIASNTPLDVATEWFRKVQNRRSNWRGATNHGHYREFLISRGMWVAQVDYPRDGTVRTLGDFARWHAKPGSIYVVRSSGHAMAVKDGYIADQHHILPVAQHWCRNKRLLNHWEIL